MKKIFSTLIIATMFTSLAAYSATATTKVFSNKYLNVSVEHPTIEANKPNLPETETEKKIKETKSNIENTKKSIYDIKKTWGMK